MTIEKAPPEISVIVPAFKVTAYITAALDSLRTQTFRNFETIVINDACPDTEQLEKVLEPYRGEIVYLKSDQWTTLSGSRNTGIMAARSPLIALLDGDDEWTPDYLAVQKAFLDSHPDVDLVYPNATFFGIPSWEGKTFMETSPSNGDPTLEKVIQRECCVFVGVTAKREAMIRAGLFDVDLRGAEDIDMWMRMLKTGSKFAYHQQPLVRYRQRQSSLSDDKVELIRSALVVYEKFAASPSLTPEERSWCAQAIDKHNALMKMFVGRKALYAGNTAQAITLLSSANEVLHNNRLRAMIWALKRVPRLVYRYVHTRHDSEYSFLH